MLVNAIYEFDEFENSRIHPDTGERLYNFWGYSTVGFFAPKAAYAATGSFGMQVDEFKQLVKSFHRAGIEVILDVVFNHTAEGGADGPSFCFRGLGNRTYYLLDSASGAYVDDTGCGNTFNANQAVVRRLIRHSLRYWVQHMHVDGFRFDLATTLARGPNGFDRNHPLLAAIRQKQAKNPEQAVVIGADKDVRYESVLDVMDMLQQNQVKKVGLLVKPRGQ